MPFAFAFSFAFFIASSTISAPTSVLQFSAIVSPIVPVPQYKSSRISSFCRFAYSFALPYSFSAWARFTCQNENGDILNLSPHKTSVMWSLPYATRFFLPKTTFVFSLLELIITLFRLGKPSFNILTSSSSCFKPLPLTT